VRPTVLLFDVDGTLLHAGGAGRRAIVRTFEARCGRRDLFDDVRFHGMTDRGIVRDALARAGLECDEPTIDAICAEYLAVLAEEMPQSTAFRVFPGVPPLLDALAQRAGVAVGVGTGNLREGARLKLARAALAHHFTFGGFGCDHEDRAAIVRIGAERGARTLGAPLDACRVVVIGDTPRDVAAARAIGAQSLTVETGGIPMAELAAAGATWTRPDLAGDGVLDLLLGAARS
jgi:phosphoglycolate phosphatase-like HAD superfamily hydrolase